MENKVLEFLSFIEKETEISIDYSSIEIAESIETEDMIDIETMKSLTMATYLSEISFRGHPLIITLEHYSTETFDKIIYVIIQTVKGAIDYFVGAKVLGQMKEVAPGIPVYISRT